MRFIGTIRLHIEADDIELANEIADESIQQISDTSVSVLVLEVREADEEEAALEEALADRMKTKKEQIRAWLIAMGWEQAQHGHLFKTFKRELHRIVLKETSWQNDVQLSTTGEWRTVEVGRYSHTKIIDGILYGEKCFVAEGG